jgi:hypothetical protein
MELWVMEVIVYSRNDLLIDGRKFSSPEDHWQRAHGDNVAGYSKQKREKREAAQTAGFRLKSGSKSQVVTNHEISSQRVTKSYIQAGRNVEPQINLGKDRHVWSYALQNHVRGLSYMLRGCQKPCQTRFMR